MALLDYGEFSIIVVCPFAGAKRRACSRELWRFGNVHTQPRTKNTYSEVFTVLKFCQRESYEKFKTKEAMAVALASVTSKQRIDENLMLS